MKKSFLLFLVTILLPMVVSADDTVEIDGIYYNLVSKDKVAEVTKRQMVIILGILLFQKR